jgi:hypothetical protein
VVNDQTITVGKVVIGAGATNVGSSYVGPVVVSPTYETDYWAVCIEDMLSSGSGVLYGALGNTALLVPLGVDGTGYQKVGGVSPLTLTPPALATVDYDPYASIGANTYKVGLHFHTTESDATGTPTEMANAFKTALFDACICTDHNVVTADPAVGGIVWVAGDEETVVTSGSHVVVWPATADLSALFTMQEIIDGGDVVVLAHPNYATSMDPITLEDALAVTGYDAVEIYNAAIPSNVQDATDIWDGVLTAGRQVWGTSATDAHNTAVTATCLRVFADACTEAALVTAVKAGNFYAAMYTMQISIARTATYLRISSTDSCNMEFIGPSGTTLETVTGVTAHTFHYYGRSGYVRCEVTRVSDGYKCWTQPVFFA